MENLIISGSHNTYFTPDIKLNADSGKCMISGESYLEEPYSFYKQIVGWFQEYTKQKKELLEINFKLVYFNTSSSRAILELLRELKTLQDAGHTVVINWYYPNPDYDEMLMEGEDFMEESGCTMSMLEYTL